MHDDGRHTSQSRGLVLGVFIRVLSAGSPVGPKVEAEPPSGAWTWLLSEYQGGGWRLASLPPQAGVQPSSI